ncbi:MAG: hypothetical protein M0C28_07250 [Candidatus Moduliflexus flocculans]|nr:hypothetical protein [Candidatus Moduliflexus flocculans]
MQSVDDADPGPGGVAAGLEQSRRGQGPQRSGRGRGQETAAAQGTTGARSRRCLPVRHRSSSFLSVAVPRPAAWSGRPDANSGSKVLSRNGRLTGAGKTAIVSRDDRDHASGLPRRFGGRRRRGPPAASRRRRGRGPAGAGPAPPFTLGLASYTFREFDLDATLAMAKRVGLMRLALKDVHLPLESPAEAVRAAAAKVRAAGLELYGCGVVYMTNESEVDRAFDYARSGGMERHHRRPRARPPRPGRGEGPRDGHPAGHPQSRAGRPALPDAPLGPGPRRTPRSPDRRLPRRRALPALRHRSLGGGRARAARASSTST